MNETSFVYTATGAEGSDFFIALPAARTNDSYFVIASLAGVARLVAIDLPNAAPGDRTTTQFRVVTSAALQASDRIEISVYDPSPGGAIVTFGAADLGTSVGPTHMVPGFAATLSTGLIAFAAPRAGFVRSVYARVAAAGTGAATVSFTVRLNNVDTALATTIANTSTGETHNTSNGFAVAAGDSISVVVAKSAAVAQGQTNVVVTLSID